MNKKKLICILGLGMCILSSIFISALAVSKQGKKTEVAINKGTNTTGKWHKEDSQWYFVEDGVRVRGWLKNNGQWYFLDKEGIMQTSWVKYKSNWYYLNESGVMQTGWIKDKDGKWYYLYSNGVMAQDTVIDGYVLNESGVWIK